VARQVPAWPADARDNDQPRLGAWPELSAADPAAAMRAAFNARLTEVQRQATCITSWHPEGQVFTIAPE
jgi:hypothetical protein